MSCSAVQKSRHSANTVEGLVSRVLRLPPSQLWHFLDRMVGRAEVEVVGFRVKPKRESIEKYPERNAEIRRRYIEGETQGQLALDYGLTPSGIAKIIQRGRRKSPGR
jgi:hypothetical protein